MDNVENSWLSTDISVVIPVFTMWKTHGFKFLFSVISNFILRICLSGQALCISVFLFKKLELLVKMLSYSVDSPAASENFCENHPNQAFRIFWLYLGILPVS